MKQHLHFASILMRKRGCSHNLDRQNVHLAYFIVPLHDSPTRQQK